MAANVKLCSTLWRRIWLKSSVFYILLQRKNRKEQKPFQDLENDIANVKIAISKKKAQLDECIVVADRSRGRCVKAQDEEKKLKNELETIRNEKIKLENEGEREF